MVQFWTYWYVAWGWLLLVALVPIWVLLAVFVVRAVAEARSPRLETATSGADRSRSWTWLPWVLAGPLAGGVGVAALFVAPLALPVTHLAVSDALGPGWSFLYVPVKAAFAAVVGVEVGALVSFAHARRQLLSAMAAADGVGSRAARTRLVIAAILEGLLLLTVLGLALFAMQFGGIHPWIQVMTQMGDGLVGIR